jgi:hypothetical protein
MVNNDYLVIKSCSELRVLATIHTDVRPNIVALCNTSPPIAKGGSVKGHSAAHDCDKAAAGP